MPFTVIRSSPAPAGRGKRSSQTVAASSQRSCPVSGVRPNSLDFGRLDSPKRVAKSCHQLVPSTKEENVLSFHCDLVGFSASDSEHGPKAIKTYGPIRRADLRARIRHELHRIGFRLLSEEQAANAIIMTADSILLILHLLSDETCPSPDLTTGRTVSSLVSMER